MDWIDDHPDGCKGQVICIRCPRNEVRFHIDRHRTGSHMQGSLGRGVHNRRIDADDWPMADIRNGSQQFSRPNRIRLSYNVRVADSRRHHDISGPKIGSEAAGHSEADDATATFLQRPLQCAGQLASGTAANHENTVSSGDPRFEGESNQGDDGKKHTGGGELDRQH
jgi:hypothetical protein